MKIGLLQYPFYPEAEKTFQTLCQQVEKAENVDLLIAPELGLTGYESALELAFVRKALDTIQQKLASKNLPLLIGGADPETLTSAIWLITPDKIQKVAEKVNLFPGFDEEKGFKPGSLLPPFEIKDIPCGALVCFDLRFPELAKRLVCQGAQVLFILAAWPKERIKHFQSLVCARALENQVFAVGANALGLVQDIELGGQSIAFDPWGEKLLEAKSEGVFTFALDFKRLAFARSFFTTSRLVPPPFPQEKILPLDELLIRSKWQRQLGQKMVFTNGCFDILHAGHVNYLAKARAAGDFLVVGLNSDASVKRIKGPLRPVNPEKMRAQVLASLSFVDYVTIFEEDTPEKLIKALKPDVLVKGADWPEEKIVGASFVKSYGGRVLRIPFEHQISTSQIIAKIKDEA